MWVLVALASFSTKPSSSRGGDVSDEFSVTKEELRNAGIFWDVRHVSISSGRLQLSNLEGSTDALGRRVGPVFATFLTNWISRMSDHLTDISSISEALSHNEENYDRMDQELSASLAGLVNWDDVDRPTS